MVLKFDTGSNYPNATGHDDGTAEQMPVEECGDIIILAYMYQLASGDTAWALKYTSLFRGYADYLVTNGLYPTTQLSTDDGAGSSPNQTNLAIKAAVALNAYGAMTGQTNYSDTGRRFADILYYQTAGTDSGRTHFTLIQGEEASWTTAFNLYPDLLLGLNTFPTAASSMQSSWYEKVRASGGVALDSAEDWGKTDWMTWSAALAGTGQPKIRDMLINDVHAFLTNGLNDVPFSDKFFVKNKATDVEGHWDGYKNRPVVGGHLALLALEGVSLFG